MNSNQEFQKRLYSLILAIIKFLDGLPNDNVSRRIGDQLLRSSTSILGNFIEGKAASSRKDFINFFNHSLKSSNESKLWLELLRDTKRAGDEEVNKFIDEIAQISKIFGASIVTLKRKESP